MNKIWKWELPVMDVQTLRLPAGAQILSVQYQPGSPGLSLWASADPAAPLMPRQFAIAGTGHNLPAGASKARHIATVQQEQWVWHVFDLGWVEPEKTEGQP